MKTKKNMTALKRLKVIAVFSMIVSIIMLAAYSREIEFFYGILDWKDNQYPALEQQVEVDQQNYSIEPISEETIIFNEVDKKYSDKRKLKIAKGIFWIAYVIWNLMNIQFIIRIREDELKKGFWESIIENGQRKYGVFKSRNKKQ